MLSSSDVERFKDKFIPESNSGCWLWTDSQNKDGYGQFGVTKNKGWKQIIAHRASWIIHNGEIKDELWVLHKCDLPCCVNPDHLYLGTHADNERDKVARKRGAFGLKNGKYTHPERTPRGAKHGSRTKPGRLPHGEAHHNARLTWDHVCEIRKACCDGENQREIATRFETTQATVSRIYLLKTRLLG